MCHSRLTIGAAIAALTALTFGSATALHPLVGVEALLHSTGAVEPAPLGLVDVIQQVDQILESVVDLVETVNRLFGEGAEGAEGAAGAGGEGGD